MTKYIVFRSDDERSYREIEATSVVRAAEIAHAELISQALANQSRAAEKIAALDACDWFVIGAHRDGSLRDCRDASRSPLAGGLRRSRCEACKLRGGRGEKVKTLTCPNCGQRAAVAATLETHEGSSGRVCSASGSRISVGVATLKAAVAAERKAAVAAKRAANGGDR